MATPAYTAERFDRVAERMPHIAAAIAGFDGDLREQAFYSLLAILDSDPDSAAEPIAIDVDDVPNGTVRSVTAARLASVIRDTETSARADTRARDWYEDAAKSVLVAVRDSLVEQIRDLEIEQSALMANRRDVGLGDQAREHAIRARTHRRDKNLVREILSDTGGA